MTKAHFEKKFDEENGWHFAQVLGQAQKNDQAGSANLKEGGVITFEPLEESGLNCGRYIELFLKTLNPQNKYIFQKPKFGKKFKIHKPEEKTYYFNSKVGHSLIGRFMPMVNISF